MAKGTSLLSWPLAQMWTVDGDLSKVLHLPSLPAAWPSKDTWAVFEAEDCSLPAVEDFPLQVGCGVNLPTGKTQPFPQSG